MTWLKKVRQLIRLIIIVIIMKIRILRILITIMIMIILTQIMIIMIKVIINIIMTKLLIIPRMIIIIRHSVEKKLLLSILGIHGESVKTFFFKRNLIKQTIMAPVNTV